MLAPTTWHRVGPDATLTTPTLSKQVLDLGLQDTTHLNTTIPPCTNTRHTSSTLSHPPTNPAFTLSPAAAVAVATAEATRVMQRILSLPAAAPLQMKGGLLRRLRATQLSLMGPPPFVRRAERRPESPAGELLDGERG